MDAADRRFTNERIQGVEWYIPTTWRGVWWIVNTSLRTEVLPTSICRIKNHRRATRLIRSYRSSRTYTTSGRHQTSNLYACDSSSHPKKSKALQYSRRVRWQDSTSFDLWRCCHYALDVWTRVHESHWGQAGGVAGGGTSAVGRQKGRTRASGRCHTCRGRSRSCPNVSVLLLLHVWICVCVSILEEEHQIIGISLWIIIFSW